MAPIYRNDRVKVAIDSEWAPVGTRGKYLGRDPDSPNEPGSLMVVIRATDGLEIKVPLMVLELDKEFVMDAMSWFTDIPQSDSRRYVRVVDQVRKVDGTVFELQGSSERWFIVRVKPDGTTERTKFFPNQRDAKRVFEELAGA